MEFPDTGVQCALKECTQLDFLPFTCTYCSNTFCKEHFHGASHLCSKLNDNIASGTEKTITFGCASESCSSRSPVEMPCVKCKKHFCLSHRYHGCLEQSEEEKLNELKKWEKPKQDFLEAKSVVDKEVTNKLRKSKNSTMANKVQLMKLKGKSTGSNSIPTADRRYFLVHLPINDSTKNFGDAKGVFVSVSWSLGKVIDSIADSLNIPNSNNIANANKLRIFDYFTGNIISNQMDVILLDILNASKLTDGQDIILEYSTDNRVDISLYK